MSANRVRAIAAFLVAFPAMITAPPVWADKVERPGVMVLGTFHFQGSTSDKISVTMGDVRSPRRQAEIKAVVERLKKLAPTKIAIELARKMKRRLMRNT